MMEARTRPFFSVFRAEVLKGRRGAPRKVALIAPLPFCALGVLSSGVIPGTGATGGVATYLWNFWYVLMMPVAIALICVSVANIDARQKLRSVLALPFPRRARGGRRCATRWRWRSLRTSRCWSVRRRLERWALMPPVLPRGWPRRPS